MIPQAVKKALNTVFQAISNDPKKLTELPPAYCGKEDERAYTVENLENIAANHAFDDNPNVYGITELEGSIVRHYFSTGAETYDFVIDLRKEFPDFFRHPETEEYVGGINNRRRDRGLSSILV